VALIGVLVTADTVAAYPFCSDCRDCYGAGGGITAEVLARLRGAGVPIAVLPPTVAAYGHA
jgi:hypothetical protein